MTIKIDRDYRLTTDHAASSYNQPVLIDIRTGIAYGTGDLVDEGVFGLTPATEIVRNYANKVALKIAMTRGGSVPSDEETAMLAKFLA